MQNWYCFGTFSLKFVNQINYIIDFFREIFIKKINVYDIEKLYVLFSDHIFYVL
jgi:hypothetical protein